MGICYKGLGEDNKAKVAFDLAGKLLESDEQKEQLEYEKNAKHIVNKKQNFKGKFC